MLSPVYFNNKFLLNAYKIHNEWPNRVLAAKLPSSQLCRLRSICHSTRSASVRFFLNFLAQTLIDSPLT
jgi:hypothetical protein